MKYIHTAVILAVIILLTGCGSKAPKETSLTGQGMALIEEMDYDSAIDKFQQSIANGKDEQYAYRGLGIIYYNTGRLEEAKEAFLNSLQSSSGSIGQVEADVTYYLGTVYQKLGETQEAIVTFTNLLVVEETANLYFLRGSAYLDNDNLEDGQKDFERAVKLGPKDADLYISIFQCLQDAGYQDAGYSYLNQALDIDGSKPVHDYNRGRIYYYLGDYGSAKTALDKAIEKDYTEALLYLGMVFEAQEDPDGAMNQYIAYLDKYPESAKAYNQIGVCQLQQEAYEAALSYFETGIALSDESVMQNLLFNEITAYEYLGDYQTAAEKMESYLEIYPEDEEAVREDVFIQSRL